MVKYKGAPHSKESVDKSRKKTRSKYASEEEYKQHIKEKNRRYLKKKKLAKSGDPTAQIDGRLLRHGRTEPLPTKPKFVKQTKEEKGRASLECRLKRQYGMSIEDRAQLLSSQGGRCKVCGMDLTAVPSKAVHIDHNHETGRVRGILCHYCNVGLGSFGDDVERLKAAILYLTTATTEFIGEKSRANL